MRASSRNADQENPPGKGSPGPHPAARSLWRPSYRPEYSKGYPEARVRGQKTQKSRPETPSKVADQQDLTISNYTQDLSTEMSLLQPGTVHKVRDKEKTLSRVSPRGGLANTPEGQTGI